MICGAYKSGLKGRCDCREYKAPPPRKTKANEIDWKPCQSEGCGHSDLNHREEEE